MLSVDLIAWSSSDDSDYHIYLKNTEDEILDSIN